MAYSEKTARRLEKYVIKLIRSQPKWIRRLFHSDEMVFVVDDNDGTICVHCKETVSKDQREQAGRVIKKYMDEHPLPKFEPLVVQ